MHKPKVSVVIVSRDRPGGLLRLLKALKFQFYDNFEIIVVTNYTGKLPPNVKLIHYNKANISAARNLGIDASAGELIAFCDDDAIPEPIWLEKLTSVFVDPEVGMSGGFVRGRNGIDFQWKAASVDKFGQDVSLEFSDETKIQILTLNKGLSPKLQGTNCIFRKKVFVELGGFDENFEFFLDETDMCLRASQSGWKTAIVPYAEVQHGFYESDRRTSFRVPKDLFLEGKSKAYFCNKHAKNYDNSFAVAQFKTEQKNRLIKHMVAGLLIPKDVKYLLHTLEDGLIEGQKIYPIITAQKFKKTPAPFLQYYSNENSEKTGEIFAGSIISKSVLMSAAEQASKTGISSTVFCWSFTTLFHRRYFDERGFWVQLGGLFGKSNRKSAVFHFETVKSRSIKESVLIKNLRRIRNINLFRFKKIHSVIK